MPTSASRATTARDPREARGPAPGTRARDTRTRKPGAPALGTRARDTRTADTREPGTRERIVNTTAELFRRQGYTGTGVKQIVAEAHAPFGSLYHFFPGGKEQLGTEVLHIAGDMYLALFVEIAAQADDVPGAIADFFSGAAQTLRDTDYADACPIATVALEVASTSEPLRLASAEVFTRWIDAASAFIASAGVGVARARSLALTMLCLLEGGFLFSRALRDTEPLQAAGASAVAAIRAALADAGDPGE